MSVQTAKKQCYMFLGNCWIFQKNGVGLLLLEMNGKTYEHLTSIKKAVTHLSSGLAYSDDILNVLKKAFFYFAAGLQE